MLRQVREPPDAERLCAIVAHRKRIGVVEAERHAGGEPLLRERAVQLLEGRLARKPHDLGGDGAGVLRVDIDGAGFQRREHDAGVAQARPVLAAGGARQDLAEDVGLGEALGADADRVLRLRPAGRRANCGEQEQGELHRAKKR